MDRERLRVLFNKMLMNVFELLRLTLIRLHTNQITPLEAFDEIAGTYSDVTLDEINECIKYYRKEKKSKLVEEARGLLK